jgi:hypothetical protein
MEDNFDMEDDEVINTLLTLLVLEAKLIALLGGP